VARRYQLSAYDAASLALALLENATLAILTGNLPVQPGAKVSPSWDRSPMSNKSSGTDPLMVRRAEELDALDAILPFDRRRQTGGTLTGDDLATLKHLANEGMGRTRCARSRWDTDIPESGIPILPRL
jgi:hypothetical protein